MIDRVAIVPLLQISAVCLLAIVAEIATIVRMKAHASNTASALQHLRYVYVAQAVASAIGCAIAGGWLVAARATASFVAFGILLEFALRYGIIETPTESESD